MKTPKILIVEEDFQMREKLSKGVEDWCAGEVISLSDGYEALLKIRKESFDLIITNFMLPGADGIKILIAAKQKNFKSVVFIIDRTDDAHITKRIDDLGGLFIAKPVNLKHVRNSIERDFVQRCQ